MNGLPLPWVDPVHHTAPSTRTNGTDSRPKYILVIDDTPEILDLFRDILEAEGYEVSLYACDPKHLDEIEAQPPDLVILDYLIGGEPAGWQFLQMLKMTRGTAQIPVIVCTAAVNQIRELGAHLHRMGVGVVLKPFNVDDLLAEIEQHWTDRANKGAQMAHTDRGALEPTSV
jgi:CheY-like chemotaxis protein